MLAYIHSPPPLAAPCEAVLTAHRRRHEGHLLLRRCRLLAHDMQRVRRKRDWPESRRQLLWRQILRGSKEERRFGSGLSWGEKGKGCYCMYAYVVG